MFLLKLYDRDRIELNLGDIVEISDGRHFKFYCRVTFMEPEQKIAPFHTFSFHSVRKVDAVPENAVPCTEPRFECWYVANELREDSDAAAHAHYLMEWRKCERLLESCFDLVPVPTHYEMAIID